MEEDIKHLEEIKENFEYSLEHRTSLTDEEYLNAHRKSLAIKNILNELERLQKDNEALEYQLKCLHAENNNITRELLARTDELNKLLEENKRLNGKIKRYTRYLENKDKKMEELLEYEYTEREQDYIPKQVIQDKIEELEEEKLCFYSDYAIEERNDKIQVLKEILGDE